MQKRENNSVLGLFVKNHFFREKATSGINVAEAISESSCQSWWREIKDEQKVCSKEEV